MRILSISLVVALSLTGCAAPSKAPPIPEGKGRLVYFAKDYAGGQSEYRAIIIEVRNDSGKLVFDFDESTGTKNYTDLVPGEYLFASTCRRDKKGTKYWRADETRYTLEPYIKFYDVLVQEKDTVRLKINPNRSRTSCLATPMIRQDGKFAAAPELRDIDRVPNWHKNSLQKRVERTRRERTNSQIRQMMERDIERARQGMY